MADTLRRAMEIAAAHGMVLRQSPDDPGLANIRCRDCGWPGLAFDARIIRYVRKPHGCHPCAWEHEQGSDCPNFPARAERPAFYGIGKDQSGKEQAA